eukprot:4511233-Amphidinium_carterae.2
MHQVHFRQALVLTLVTGTKQELFQSDRIQQRVLGLMSVRSPELAQHLNMLEYSTAISQEAHSNQSSKDSSWPTSLTRTVAISDVAREVC